MIVKDVVEDSVTILVDRVEDNVGSPAATESEVFASDKVVEVEESVSKLFVVESIASVEVEGSESMFVVVELESVEDLLDSTVFVVDSVTEEVVVESVLDVVISALVESVIVVV